MDKNSRQISEEEWKEYQALKQGKTYVKPKEYLATPISIERVVKEAKSFLLKESKYR